MIAAGLTVLGVGIASSYKAEILKWLEADIYHGAVVVLSVLLLLAILALDGMEREADAKQFVHPSISKIRGVFRPVLHFHEGTKHNILIVETDVRFRNDTEKTTRAYFPKVEILWRHKRSKWQPLELTAIDALSLNGDFFLRGLAAQFEPWYPDQRHEIPSLDDAIGRFQIEGTIAKENIYLLDKADFKIKLTIDIVGSGVVTLEQRFPKIDKVPYA